MKSSLLKNTLIYTIGNFGSKVLTFALVPLYSFYLTKEELGLYDLILTTIQLLVPIVTLQMSEAVYRWMLEERLNIDTQKNIAKQTTFVLIISLLIFQTIGFILLQFVSKKYSTEFFLLIISSSLLPYFQQLIRGLNKPLIYSISGIINSILILAFSVLFLISSIFQDKVSGIFYALIFANLISIIFLGINSIGVLKNIFGKGVDFKFQRSLILYSLPLIFNSISWWLINASNRYVILEYLTLEDNGIFAIASRLPALLTIFNSVFILAWQDMVVSSDEDNSELFSKIFNNYININLGLTSVLISASPILTMILFDDKFFESWKYAPFLYIGSCFSSISGFLGAIYLKSKRTRGILSTSLIAAAVNLIFTIVFIHSIGLYAAAIGSAISFIIMFIIRYYHTSSMVTLKINLRTFLIQTSILIILLSSLYFSTNFFWYLFVLLCSIVSLFWNNSLIFKELFVKAKILRKR